MRTVTQSYSSGELLAQDTCQSFTRSSSLLLRTAASVVSAGTEKAMIDVAKKSLLGKALARPDWVKQVLDKVRTEGFAEAYRQSFARLDMPVPLGYASAGVVAEVGRGVADFAVGDRVTCSGSGYASHAELVSVPRNLCCPIPAGVGFAEASFAALGGIALEAVRCAHVELGHRIVVIGLGLLGQLAVQILTAAGCHVLGVDTNHARNDLALTHGAEAVAPGAEPAAVVAAGRAFTRGHGADSVIILASAPSNEPLELAAELCRERGRVVATGLIGLEAPRKPFYEKELELVISRAWGPGLYDPDYEQRDVKYPLPYVRWTASRNMAEFLDLLALGRVRLDRIITHRFPFDRALEAYTMILEHKEPFLGVVLEYPYEQPLERVTRIDLKAVSDQQSAVSVQESAVGDQPPAIKPAVFQLKVDGRKSKADGLGVGLIGAGLYARGTLLPALAKIEGLRYVGVSTSTGLSARHVGEKWGFGYCTTDYHELLADPAIQAVIILTRHASHARLAAEALRAGKAVFVEKPLALDARQLAEVVAVCQLLAISHQPSVSEPSTPNLQPRNPRPQARNPLLMVGFNRRFAPDTIRMRRAMAASQGPFLLYVRANAGYIPADSWVHQPDEGGGRIIGELCHFVDLASALTASRPVRVQASEARTPQGLRDNLTVILDMADGSAATLVYTSAGDKSFPREYVEVFGGGLAATIDNFKGSSITRGGRTDRRRAWGADRGHVAELAAFFAALRHGRESPVALDDYVATTLATFAIEESLACRQPVAVDVSNLNLSGIN